MKHTSRFGPDDWNEKMIQRLDDILSSKTNITDYDKRFYTHEIREFERYKAMGFEDTLDKDIPNARDVWNNAHSAALEDYKISEKEIINGKEVCTLYHPSIQ